MPDKNETRRLLGRCAVDSGTLILVDPCYVDQDEHGLPEGPLRKTEWLEALYPESSRPRGLTHAPVRNGVVFGTRIGDGVYPVYGIYDAGGQLARVQVEFVPHEDEDDEEDDDTTECDGCPATIPADTDGCEDCGLILCDACLAEHELLNHPGRATGAAGKED